MSDNRDAGDGSETVTIFTITPARGAIQERPPE